MALNKLIRSPEEHSLHLMHVFEELAIHYFNTARMSAREYRSEYLRKSWHYLLLIEVEKDIYSEL